ncbi:MAG: dihydrofolate reductase [Streptosporangiaceae bacterium]
MITSLIVAAAAKDVIGAGGALPWHLPEDLRRFRRLTTGHAVVLGRVTHESIVARLGRPLPGRTSVVVSSRTGQVAHPGVVWAGSVTTALATAHGVAAGGVAAAGGGVPGAGGTDGGGEPEVFVLGGASVYEQALPLVDRVYLTRVHREVAGDTRMPPGWLAGFTLAGRDDRPAGGGGAGGYSFLEYERRPG